MNNKIIIILFLLTLSFSNSAARKGNLRLPTLDQWHNGDDGTTTDENFADYDSSEQQQPEALALNGATETPAVADALPNKEPEVAVPSTGAATFTPLDKCESCEKLSAIILQNLQANGQAIEDGLTALCNLDEEEEDKNCREMTNRLFSITFGLAKIGYGKEIFCKNILNYCRKETVEYCQKCQNVLALADELFKTVNPPLKEIISQWFKGNEDLSSNMLNWLQLAETQIDKWVSKDQRESSCSAWTCEKKTN